MGRTGELQVRLFGPFEVRRGGDPLEPSDFGRRKTRQLLKYLLIKRGHVFTKDEIIEALFPDLDPEKAIANLQSRISKLRGVLEPDLERKQDSQFILQVGDGYCFSRDASCWLDVEQFQKRIDDAREDEDRGRWIQARDAYGEAVQLYRGDFLQDERYEEWTLAARERWRERYLDALQRLSECHARLRAYPQAIDCAQQVLEFEPHNETAYRGLMRYHYHDGNQAAALQAYESCVRALKERLDVEPMPETEELYDRIRAHDVPQYPKAVPNNLPAPWTSFVGREDEIAQTKSLLAENRLLTLTGVGGTGKTRLALQAASELLEAFEDGVWWSDLTAIPESSSLPQAVASALNVHDDSDREPQDAMTDALRSKTALLVLDTGEHVVGPCATLVQTLLESCPEIKVLVTSQQVLGLPGEAVIQVPPLPPPDPDVHASLESLQHNEAVQLFVDRASVHDPQFDLTHENAEAVARICRALDGLPLAIELAAARIRGLTAPEISRRLSDRFRLLTGHRSDSLPRHRTLQAAMDWSWELLSDQERTLLRRLSAFRSAFSLDDVSAVCAFDPLDRSDVSRLVADLTEKSLLSPDRVKNQGRYRLLETVRQYAAARCREANDWHEVARRHADWFRSLAERSESELRGPRQKAWLRLLSAHQDNLRAALERSMTRDDVETGLRLAGALGRFWERRAHLSEGRRWLERVLSTDDQGRPTSSRAKALQRAGWLAWYQADYDRAREHFETGAALSRELDDRSNLAAALDGLGTVAKHQSDFETARRHHERALEINRELGDVPEQAVNISNLGTVEAAQGRYRAAQDRYETALRINQEHGDRYEEAINLGNLGSIALHQGEHSNARTLCEHALAIHRELGHRSWEAIGLNRLGMAAAASGNEETARRHYEQSLQIRQDIGDRRGVAATLNNLGILAFNRGDYDEARAQYERSLEVERDLGDRRGIAISLNNLGLIAFNQGDRAAAESYHEQSLDLKRALDDPHGVAASLNNLGLVALDRGDPEAADRHFEESLEVKREIGDEPGIAESLSNAALAAEAQGDLERARSLHERCLQTSNTDEDPKGMGISLVGLAGTVLQVDQPERAATLLGAADRLFNADQSTLHRCERSLYDRRLRELRNALDEEAFEEAYRAGQTLPPERAVNLAVNQEERTSELHSNA